MAEKYKILNKTLQKIVETINTASEEHLKKLIAFLLLQASSVNDMELKKLYNEAIKSCKNVMENPEAALEYAKNNCVPPHEIRIYLSELCKPIDGKLIEGGASNYLDKASEIIVNIFNIWNASNRNKQQKKDDTIAYLEKIQGPNTQLPSALEEMTKKFVKSYNNPVMIISSEKLYEEGNHRERPAAFGR